MRLSCLQENLSRGLSIVGRAVASRTTLPVTQNVLLATDQARLRLSATNLEIAISTWVGARVDQEGALTIPARLLTEFVNSLPSDRIDLEVQEQPRGLHLSCARFQARINGIDAEEFPPVPRVEEGLVVSIGPQALRSAINQVVLAAATEDSRPVLTGVKVDLDGDRITFAAADGFRLAVHTATLGEAVTEGASFIVPARTLNEVNRLLSDQDEPVEIVVAANQSQVLFRLKNVELVSQLIQGTFPDYGQLIPTSYTTRTVVSTEEFRKAARAASIFARDGTGIVRIMVQPGSPGTLQLMASSDEVGENSGELDAEVEGQEGRVAFNNRYLLDVLGVLQAEQVALEINTSSSPGVIRPVGSEGYVHVIMPMFVQW